MKDTIINWLFWVFVLIAVVTTIYGAITSFNFWALSDLIPIVVAAYERSSWLFRTYNQIVAWFKNNTISLTTTFHIYCTQDFKIADLSDSIQKSLNTCHITFDKGSIQEINAEKFEQTNHCQFNLINEHQLKFGLEITRMNYVDETELAVTLSYQLSYKQLKSTWLQFKEFKDIFMQNWKTSKNRNDLTINMANSDLSPFYRLTLKSINAKDLSNVNLSFKEKNASIKITEHQIYISSSSSQTIDDVIAQIIPMTHVY